MCFQHLRRLLTIWALTVLTTSAWSQHTYWPDPAAHHIEPAMSVGLTHGPMLGRPGATSIGVWIRTETNTPFRVRYARHLPLGADSPTAEGKTEAGKDNTGFIELRGLNPDTRYFYGVELDGKLADTRAVFTDPWPSFRTLPDADTFRDARGNPNGRFNFCFAIGAGNSQNPKTSAGQYSDAPVWHTMMRRHGKEIRFVIMNGDYTYEEQRDGTLAGVRRNYKLYMQRSLGMSRIQRYIPWLFMYDDHEVEDNLFGAGEIGFRLGRTRYMHRDVHLGPWQEYAGWANPEAAHRGVLRLGSASVKKGRNILHDPKAEFTSLRSEQVSTILVRKGQHNVGTYGLVEVIDARRLKVTPPFRADGTIDYSVGTHHYYDWKLGNCHFFVLDTRGERSHFNRNDFEDPATFLLGKAQREWLVGGIERTDAQFVFVVSSVGLVVPHSIYHVKREGGDKSKGDGFPGFLHERESILNALEKVRKPILFFTGDVHNSVCARVSANIWECMAAPLSSKGHPIGTLGNMPYSGWYEDARRRAQIRWVAGWPNSVHYSRLHSSIYALVRVNNVLKSARPEGEGYQFVAYEHPQVIVSWYDAYTGHMLYSETVSTMDTLGPSEKKPGR